MTEYIVNVYEPNTDMNGDLHMFANDIADLLAEIRRVHVDEKHTQAMISYPAYESFWIVDFSEPDRALVTSYEEPAGVNHEYVIEV